MPIKKIANITEGCVACGCCEKICSKKAIFIHKGMWASVKKNVCIGCGKCSRACPAGVIKFLEVKYEETVV